MFLQFLLRVAQKCKNESLSLVLADSNTFGKLSSEEYKKDIGTYLDMPIRCQGLLHNAPI